MTRIERNSQRHAKQFKSVKLACRSVLKSYTSIPRMPQEIKDNLEIRILRFYTHYDSYAIVVRDKRIPIPKEWHNDIGLYIFLTTSAYAYSDICNAAEDLYFSWLRRIKDSNPSNAKSPLPF